jgi:hypothetical protein
MTIFRRNLKATEPGLEHGVAIYTPTPGDILRALEARLALAERACELADVFDRHAAWADPRYVAALNAALDEWRAAKEGTCSGSAS